MKVIDLLNKIANGEEAPKKILYVGDNYFWNKSMKFYYTQEGKSLYREMFTEGNCLNDEVEIIEEKKEIEFEDIESFGIHYSWDYIDYKNIEELKKYTNKDFQNIFDTLDKLIRNQKKIIDKLNDMRDKDVKDKRVSRFKRINKI